MKKVNVLIYPAGSENALEIYYSLKYNKHFNVFGATRVSNHAQYVYPKEKLYFGSLHITDETIFDELNRIIKECGIDFIIPTHDTIALFLTQHQDKIHAQTICSPYETTRIAENKKLMYEALNGYSFNPQIYKDINAVTRYPVFLKPYIGTGGKGTYLAKSKSELEDILTQKPNLLLCEYLPGQEYTIDCFTNKNRELLFAGPRKRERITNGIAHHSERVEESSEFEMIACELNKRFAFRGAWFFQVKEDETGQLKFMEFAVRQAGTMAFYRQLGVNFAALSLFDAMGHDVRILFNDYKMSLDRCLAASYRLDYQYETLYVDFDGALIIEDKVNTTLLKLIYQGVNTKKKIILFTKNDCDVNELLDRYHINRALFDKIVSVEPGRTKTDSIEKSGSVFIGSSFTEREIIREKCNIPVFDVDAIGCLINSADI
ncbi:MAG: carbamoylphosphate synthase large subunit short form [Firmicutes bacterium]|nr:carbamoylphosphate synthase large subunit short form [Bacillota bacterium]